MCNVCLCFNLTEYHNINGVYSLQKYKARMSYLYFWRLYVEMRGFAPRSLPVLTIDLTTIKHIYSEILLDIIIQISIKNRIIEITG